MSERRKGKLISALSGRRIGGNAEVILVEEAVEYVKLQGYIVKKPYTNTDILDIIDHYLTHGMEKLQDA